MSVIGIVGSPRSGGNSETVLDAVLAGAKANGKEVKKYNLNRMNVKGCQACMGCKKNGVCVQKDDLAKVLEDIKGAEAVVLSTPVYFGQPTGQFRLFEDRCYSYLDMELKPFLQPGKKLVTVVTCAGEDDAEATCDVLEGTYSGAFGMKPVAKFVMAGGGMPNIASGNKDLLAKAEAAGKKL